MIHVVKTRIHIKKLLLRIVIIFLFFTIVLACNSDNSTSTGTPELTSLQEIAVNSPNTPVWIANNAIKSRNGDAMGYGVILNPNSNKLLIFLDGGGACFNSLTCNGNLSSYSASDFNTRIAVEDALIINRNSPDNQFADWNFVFVPYATGDVHSGSNASADVPNGGPSDQEMVGFSNVSVILNDLKTYFNANDGITEIVFSGSSAGGFGMYLNTVQLASTFGTSIPTTILLDSGPVFTGNSLLTPCLETIWTDLWQLSTNIPADVDTVIQNSYDYDIQKMYEYLALKYPMYNFGFMSTYEDTVIRGFYSFGQANCPITPTSLISSNAFRNGLLDIKTNVLDNHNNWKVFYKEGTSHTFLGGADLNESINGTTLNQWIADLRSGTASDLVE